LTADEMPSDMGDDRCEMQSSTLAYIYPTAATATGRPMQCWVAASWSRSSR